MRIILFTITLIILSCSIGNTQNAPQEFGVVSIQHLEMKRYPGDTTAQAIILFDKGESVIEPYRGTKYTVHRRIKFFNKEAAEKWGYVNVIAPKVKISSLKGASYNLVNGVIVKAELNEEFTFKNKFDKSLDELGFTFPQVQDGTIIEYSYTITNDEYLDMRSWSFQHDIPVVWSEYSLFYPLPDGFNVDIRGPKEITEYKSKSSGQYHTWVMTHLPAFKHEPYMPHEGLYKSAINFWPKKTKWQSIYSGLMYNESFGGVIRGHGYLTKTVKELTENLSDPREKMKVISTYIKTNVQWNGISDFLGYSPKDVLKNGNGSAGDINLLLASMLEKAGLKVNVVLLSTRENGAVLEEFPSLYQFNYVICVVPLADGYVLMDATEKNAPYDILPIHCANLTGFLLTGDGYLWADLTTKTTYKTSVNASMDLTSTGELRGTVEIKKEGYEALNARKEYVAKGEEMYLNDLWKGRVVQVEKSEIENMNIPEKPVIEKYTLTIQDGINTVGSTLYLEPFIVLKESNNPFNIENRTYPIDFSAGREELFICSITIPEQYQIKQLPESKNIALPENTTRFAVNFVTLGNKIQMTCKLQLGKSLYSEQEYGALRELYLRIISKKSEPIILQKKE